MVRWGSPNYGLPKVRRRFRAPDLWRQLAWIYTARLVKSEAAILSARLLASVGVDIYTARDANFDKSHLVRLQGNTRAEGPGGRPGGDGAAPYLPEGGRRHDTMLHRTAPGPATGTRCWFRTRRAGW